MIQRNSRRMIAIALAAGAFASCQQQPQPVPPEEDVIRAAPATKPGLALSDGVLMLPIVEGRPGAAYFRLMNGSSEPVTLAGVYIDGAGSAEIHETRAGTMAKVENLEIGPGQEVVFERGGLHVMVFGLASDIGTDEGQRRETEITLTFSDGDKLSAPLTVEEMGTAMDEAGMDMGSAH